MPGETITMPVWSLVKCYLAMLITNCCLPECHRGFRRISDLKRHKCIAEREKLYMSKKKPLNVRHVRSTFEAKEAMQMH